MGRPSRRIRLGSRSAVALNLVVELFAVGGCQHRPLADPALARPSERVMVGLPSLGELTSRRVGIWVGRPKDAPARPLVLHLTGDSGRHGLDLQLFTAVTGWGYPIAVLASPDWISTRIYGAATRQSLARDLDAVARAAARATGIPEGNRLVVLGLSRGAGLAVEAAAADTPLRARLLGVVALGLCPREEWVRENGGVGRPYRDKALLGDLPLEVIQSTQDHYLSAALARTAFGPDTPSQIFHAIEATSHTFVGGRAGLLEQLRASLDRVAAP
jgi:dienelactone hydrolase